MRIKTPAALLPALTRGSAVPLTVNGVAAEAYEGETVATVLLAAGFWGLRHTRRTGEPRGVYCGMGMCFECLVNVDGVHAVRACLTPVRAGMRITTNEEVTL